MSSILGEEVLYAPVSELGQGFYRIKHYWNALRLERDSVWKKLHIKDLKPQSLAFDPFIKTEKSLKTAFNKIFNLACKNIYSSLIECKTNLVVKEPLKTLFCPMLGESKHMTKQTLYTSDWDSGMILLYIIGPDSNFK